uniref:rRNA N-glycosylase n=1 Tax=Aegilops tauschii TaxID=37682 RepID=M8BAW5_AEGTA|nr:ribosome-inactivating protein 3-like [Aegilops tauschii subsp. strangulata]
MGPTRLPPTWILLTIQGTTPREAVVLAIRTDNVYIVGFKNAAGVWFAFPAFKRLIKGSTPLPKGLDYRSLVGSYGNLKYLHVNRSQVLQDVRFLSTYRLPSRPDMAHNAKLGSSLARLCVVVTETARFKTTNATVVAAMDEQGGPSRITEQETKLVVIWGVTSKSLLEWPKYGCPKMLPK